MFLWNKILTSEWGLRDLRMRRSKAGARTAGSAQNWSQAEWNGVWRGLKGSRVWGDGERPQKETFTSAPPARITLKGEPDSQKVTQTDVQTLTWSSQGAANHFYVFSAGTSAVFFLFLSAVLSTTGGFTKVRCLVRWQVAHVLKKHLFHSLPLLLTLSLHSWIFWILQWYFIIMPDLYLTKYLPDRDDLKKKKNVYSVYVLTRKNKFLERLISSHAVRNSWPHIWSWHDSHRPSSQI